MVLWQKWCFIASMEALIFYLVLLAPLSIHCAVKPASVEEDLRNQEEIQEFGKLLWERRSNGLNEEIQYKTKYTKISGDIWGLSGLVSSVLLPFPVLTQSWLLMLVHFLQHGSCCICRLNGKDIYILLLHWKLFGSLYGCTVGCSTDQKYLIVIFTHI